VAGQGQPVVLIHGFSLDTRMWDDQFDAFAQHYQVIRYDARGFGQSAVPTESYSHVTDLRALLTYLDLRQAHIIGLSMGGGIAVNFALEYPELTRTIIPVDAPIGGHTWSRELDESMTPIGDRGRAGDVAGAKQLWLTHPLFAPANEQPTVSACLAQIVSEYSGWHWLNQDPSQSLNPPANQRLHEIHAPTLVVLGERDLPDVHVMADTMQQRIPNARKVVLPRVGHMANMEAPQAFNAVVLDFLSHHA
jgi:pimeloyl-ACP methyl ester carboxylesterase